MFVKQVSVFIENKAGRLAEVMHSLKESGIDIRALSVADTADFGIVRMLVSDSAKALDTLKSSGCTAQVTDVIAFAISDEPGELHKVMDILSGAGVNIKYLYAVNGVGDGEAGFVIKVSDSAAAISSFENAGIKIISL